MTAVPFAAEAACRDADVALFIGPSPRATRAAELITAIAAEDRHLANRVETELVERGVPTVAEDKSAQLARQRRARAICNGDGTRPACPVRDACLAWAVANKVEGVWGGTSDRQRRGMSADDAASFHHQDATARPVLTLVPDLDDDGEQSGG